MNEKQWSVICHLSGLAGYVIPFGHILAPVIIRYLKKDPYPLVDRFSREVINFQISFTIWISLAAVLVYFNIGILFLLTLIALHILLIIIAAIRADHGIFYRYPFTMRIF